MKNHIVFIVMDSCRFDTFTMAKTPHIDKIGEVQKRYSYASWTAPSHYAFTMGMLPHASPQQVFASEVYKEEFALWTERTGIDINFKNFLPELSLPSVLQKLGYKTVARVSMPVLNRFTLLNKYFDDYKLMDNHNDFASMVTEMTFPAEHPHYYFLNLGETHYPYMLNGENLPHISGVHGVFKSLDKQAGAVKNSDDEFFNADQMKSLHNQQVKCVEYVDDLFGQLIEKVPKNTYFIITSDHGELFGEDGYFGHGPIMHEKCFEVPLIEGFVKKG